MKILLRFYILRILFDRSSLYLLHILFQANINSVLTEYELLHFPLFLIEK